MIFVSFLDSSYSRSSVYFNQLLEWGKDISFRQIRPGLINTLRDVMSFRNIEKDTIVVMSPSHVIAIWIGIFTKHNIVLDAGWTLTESNEARVETKKNIWRKWKIQIIDLLAARYSRLILVESKQQKENYSKKTKTSINKIEVLYTGFNEISYRGIRGKCPIELSNINLTNKFVILFRGKANEESGLSKIIEFAKKYNDANYNLIIATNKKINSEIELSNTIVINRFISQEELVYLYSISDVAIGQMGDSPRLANTIAHKVYESLFFQVPIIVQKSRAITEIFPRKNMTIYIEDSNPNSLAKVINDLLKNPKILDELKEHYRCIYRQSLSQEHLSKIFLTLVAQHLPGINI